MARKAQAVGEQCPPGDALVVAHSLGAVPAALAYRAGDLPASHVVLLEPALYDVARGQGAVERHITAMTEARECAEAGDLFGFWQIVGPLMLGRPATRDSWHEDQTLARLLADVDAPWGHGIEGSVFAAVPTLVVTGDWSDEYEGIAQQMTVAGAEHVCLPGAKHRPQDHPGFESVLSEFTGTHR